MIIGDDIQRISDLKSHLQQKFHIKDLRLLWYFLEIDVPRSKKGISLSQRKYGLDILSEACMFKCKAADTPMDSNSKLLPDYGAL